MSIRIKERKSDTNSLKLSLTYENIKEIIEYMKENNVSDYGCELNDFYVKISYSYKKNDYVVVIGYTFKD